MNTERSLLINCQEGKSKVAIAGIMAMKPECIVLDEPTAMLDPSGRRRLYQPYMAKQT